MQERKEKFTSPDEPRKIGVFDSGIGGLTVLKALKAALPHESYVYIGDTARLPYGTKSRETVIKYSEAVTRCLLRHNIQALVVACNTASTHALEAIRSLAAPIPVVGMIDPAACAAVKATHNRHVAVIATSGTISSDIYARTIAALAPDIQVRSVACQMLVALAEEGWNEKDDPIVRAILERYLLPIFEGENPPDSLILGCTHFPVFADIITEILGQDVALINSGVEASLHLASLMPSLSKDHLPSSLCSLRPSTCFFATDDPQRFAQNALRFYDRLLSPDDVCLIDL